MTTDPMWHKGFDDSYDTNPEVWEWGICKCYENYVRKILFDPSGSWGYLKPRVGFYTASNETLYYGNPPSSADAIGGPDWTYIAGGGGWCASVSTVQKIMRDLRWGTTLGPSFVSGYLFNWANVDEAYSFDPQFKIVDARGRRVLYKGGTIDRMKAQVYSFEGANVQLTIACNSNILSPDLRATIMNAWNTSWAS